MNYHPDTGPAAPEMGWIPAPRYLLRRARLLAAMKKLRGQVLEIGCGTGALLLDLKHLGFDVTGLDTSEQARKISGELLKGHDISVATSPLPEWKGRFDVILACEVLEHIEDDTAALEEWCQWLKPGGTLIITVPAHQYLWNENDVWAGHFRRYDAISLTRVLEQAHLKRMDMIYYGFPVATFTEQLNGLIKALRKRRNKTAEPDDKAANTSRSGADRKDVLWVWPILSSVAGRWFFKLFDLMQRIPFTGKVSGGLIAVARTADQK